MYGGNPADIIAKLEQYEIEQHDIVICTCSTAGHERLKRDFDVVMLDESSQSTEPEQIIAVCRTKK